jgi:hypothetical protein
MFCKLLHCGHYTIYIDVYRFIHVREPEYDHLGRNMLLKKKIAKVKKDCQREVKP